MVLFLCLGFVHMTLSLVISASERARGAVASG